MLSTFMPVKCMIPIKFLGFINHNETCSSECPRMSDPINTRVLAHQDSHASNSHLNVKVMIWCSNKLESFDDKATHMCISRQGDYADTFVVLGVGTSGKKSTCQNWNGEFNWKNKWPLPYPSCNRTNAFVAFMV